jgi:ADP-ribosylation factor GTPase-activating protein 1
VHISFVRSIAMDSWSDKQLAIMKGGGNDKCNQYLKSRGIDPRGPIKQKYESDAAQLYKEVLKAQVEGRPEPTSLPPPTKKSYSAPPSMNQPMGGLGGGGGDPNGMERLVGESEQAYVARQTRLRDEARQRMQAKFGGSNRMGGVGSSGMQGIGSNSNYNPNGGYGAGLDDVMSGVSTAFSSGLSLVGGAASSVTSSIRTIASDPNSQGALSTLGASAGSFWGTLSSAATQVASAITQPDGDDGLEALQREFAQNKPSQSKYAGFGSNVPPPGQNHPTLNGSGQMERTPASLSGGVHEAPGLPGEDRNGVERLSGESDQQYIARQTRLREEAKARMAAKFGGKGLSSASSSTAQPSSDNFVSAPRAPASGGFAGDQATSRSGAMGSMAPARKLSHDSGADDFFASFGT